MHQRDQDKDIEIIEKHIRSYYSLLRSSGDLFLRTLEESHASMESNLHKRAGSKEIDVSAFLYSIQRLPDCMDKVKRVIMGQNEQVFKDGGIEDIFNWRSVRAKARRRLLLFDGKGTLAVFVSSLSDIDDIIPSLTAFQIEWNKMHERLMDTSIGDDLADEKVKADDVEDEIKKSFGLSKDDWELLKGVWGENWNEKIEAIALGPKNIRVNLLAGGFSDYRRAIQGWWNELMRRFEETLIEFRPLYIVSSNIHSLANLLSGFAFENRDEIVGYALQHGNEELKRIWRRLQADEDEGPIANFLYYAMQGYVDSKKEHLLRLREEEDKTGILHYYPSPYLDLKAQIIDLRSLRPEKMDQRILVEGIEKLKNSRAMILNIEYPLGFAAYHILSQILSSVKEVRGIYILGKSATMCGRLGDVMIPNIVYDMLSKNLFFFKNCFSVKHIMDYFRESAVFDNQKAITVRGTFLQNQEVMKAFHKDDYNGIEMEAGPYLCAIYENLFPERYPIEKSINLQSEDAYDIGILHYASDTPYSRRESLLSKRMGFVGVESAYGCTIGILRRIFEKETDRLNTKA